MHCLGNVHLWDENEEAFAPIVNCQWNLDGSNDFFKDGFWDLVVDLGLRQPFKRPVKL